MKHTILLVDDEPDIRFGIGKFLRSRGYAVVEAEDCQSAEAAFAASRPDAAIIDYQLPDGSALDLLPNLREIDPTAPLIVLTAYGTIAMAVAAIKEGAEQFLTKPIELAALEIVLSRALENQRNRRAQAAGRTRQARSEPDPFLGTSAAIRRLAGEVARIRDAETPILVQGETGTGKSVLARWLHDNGARSDEAFVDLNCAGLARDFLETELFGHEKGAFTGAVASKTGLFEVAHRGTVFLDEIGDMELAVQAKLLKVLEEKRFRRLGGLRDVRVDVRLIAASNQDLASLVREQRFRRDLYFRINTITLDLPPLRDRPEDIQALAERFLEEFAGEMGRRPAVLPPEAVARLESHDWPGNIRELRNVIERAVLFAEGGVITSSDLRFETHVAAPVPRSDGASPAESIAENERRFVEQILREENGSVQRAAARLGIARSALYKKIHKLGIALGR